MATWIPKQVRWVERETTRTDLDWPETTSERVLQQRWVVMNNWAEAASEWRDVPLEKED